LKEALTASDIAPRPVFNKCAAVIACQYIEHTGAADIDA